ncbi:MAG: SPOR domain-containing protein [Deltaproteobacteria bacterium]|nr:SPOR domain-containing protein [Deltaproteobacteria bacterium]
MPKSDEFCMFRFFFNVIFRDDEHSISMVIQKSKHQIAALFISIGLVFLLFNGACSQDEKPLPSPQTHKIVKAISKAPGLAKAKKPEINESLRPEPEEKSGAETKPAVDEKGELERLKIVTEKALLGEEEGYYVVNRGDTLVGVAAREDVYGDPLKWPILGRHNLDELNPMSTAEDVPDKVLPKGMKLRFFTRDEVQNNLKERGKKQWAVNVLSSPDKKEVVPVVVGLIQAGFPVYITRANIRGTDYMRVRVGFFAEKTEADAEGKRLVEILNLPDFWTVKAEEEAREYGGY